MKKRIIIIGVSAVVLIVSGILIKTNFDKNKKTIETLSNKNQELEAKIKSYGSPVSVYTVSEDILSGNVFDKTKITEMPTVDTLITDRYVVNIDDIENYIYKIDVTAGTPLTYDLFTQEIIENTDRYYDIVADIFPVEPRVGQYYDLRMVTPRGIDYIVLSKKRVHSFYGEAAKVVLNEEEIHQYQSALVDCFLNPGTYLYVDVYVEPGMQKKATIYYPPSEEVLAAMELDPNIAAVAEDALMLSNRKIYEQGLAMKEEDSSAVTSGRSNIVNKIAQAKANYESAKAEETKKASSPSGTTTASSETKSAKNNNSDTGNSATNLVGSNNTVEETSDDKKQIYEDAANFLNDGGE